MLRKASASFAQGGARNSKFRAVQAMIAFIDDHPQVCGVGPLRGVPADRPVDLSCLCGETPRSFRLPGGIRPRRGFEVRDPARVRGGIILPAEAEERDFAILTGRAMAQSSKQNRQQSQTGSLPQIVVSPRRPRLRRQVDRGALCIDPAAEISYGLRAAPREWIVQPRRWALSRPSEKSSEPRGSRRRFCQHLDAAP